MKTDQRSLWVKSILFQEFGLDKPLTINNVTEVVHRTGLSKKSSRSRKKVINYLWDKKHLRNKEGKIYVKVHSKSDGRGLVRNFPYIHPNNMKLNNNKAIKLININISKMQTQLRETKKLVKEMDKSEDVITSAIDILDKIKTAGETTVRFTKISDGSIRLMKCTLNFDKIPKKDHPKSVNLSNILKLIKNSKILHVYDLEKKGWRSIPINKIDWMNIDKTKYRVKIK